MYFIEFHGCIHIHIHIHACIHTYILLFIYVHTSIQLFIHKYYSFTHCKDTDKHSYIHTHINLFIHTYLFTYIHTYRNNVRFVELIAALKILDAPEQSVYDKLKMVCTLNTCIYIHSYLLYTCSCLIRISSVVKFYMYCMYVRVQ